MNPTTASTCDLAGLGIPDQIAVPLYGHLLRAALGPHAPLLILHGPAAHALAAAVMAGYPHPTPAIPLTHQPDPDRLCTALTTPSDTPLWLDTPGGQHLEAIAAFTHTTPTATVIATTTDWHPRRPETRHRQLALRIDNQPRQHPPVGYWAWLLADYLSWTASNPAICDRDRWLAALTHTGHPVLTGALAGWHALSDYQLATDTIDRPGWHQQLHTVATALTRKDT